MARRENQANGGIGQRDKLESSQYRPTLMGKLFNFQPEGCVRVPDVVDETTLLWRG